MNVGNSRGGGDPMAPPATQVVMPPFRSRVVYRIEICLNSPLQLEVQGIVAVTIPWLKAGGMHLAAPTHPISCPFLLQV